MNGLGTAIFVIVIGVLFVLPLAAGISSQIKKKKESQ